MSTDLNFYPNSSRRISSAPQDIFEERIQVLTLELNSIKNKERELSNSLHLTNALETQAKTRLSEIEMEKRRISDMARKFGLMDPNELLAPNTQATIESIGWANCTDINILVGFVDLHAALMRHFSDLARKVSSEVEITAVRKEKALKRSKVATEERVNPKVTAPVDREELERRNDVKKASAGDKLAEKALASLMKAGFTLQDAQMMLAGMKK